ncbi:hypothetical protein ATANTOWER_022504 [Ataeniobius toweri]|uniref:Uncharacterized protein n=1 Tax=Ataeniobius toweri TaxID=208326 RepID=A0ABU7C9M8_9TELE|nr:hypothetical protein [Ataeniobius toweri]
MAKSGCVEVAVNAGRRSRNNPDYDHPHSNIKKARHSEINFLLNFPKGANQMSLEQMRLQVLEESEKPEKKKLSIERCMQTTFALGCQEIVTGDLLVKDPLIRWPALQTESQTGLECCSE